MSIVDLAENLLLHAGTAWVLWLLVLLSTASVAVAVERGLALRAKRGDARALAARLEDALGDAVDVEAAASSLASDASTGSIVLRAGLKFASGGPEAASHAMSAAATSERAALESRLAFLGTLGNNAPFIGLFGTVIGVVSAFDELGRASAAGPSAAGQVASATVMAAIAEALVATAVGIGVALPAVAAYNLLQRRIGGIVAEVDALSSLLLAHLARRSAATKGE